jgi:glutamate carboxypeptidase
MVLLLARLVEAESPSLDAASQREPQKVLREAFERLGYRVRHVRGTRTGGHILAAPAERTRGAPLQIMIGHSDTVWPEGTLDTMPARIDDGRLYGPGTFDMKGGLVQMIYALDALENAGMRPSVTPVAFINTDEEIGSIESAPHIRRLSRRADRVFVLEPALGPSGLLKTARKGNGSFTVRVSGKAAHAGIEPEKGASAILELSLVIQKLFALNDHDRGISVNVGTIDGGLRPNVIAPQSVATVDVRVLRKEDSAWIEEAILGLRTTTPGTRLEIEGGMNRLPMERTPRNRCLWELARQCGESLGLDIHEGTSGGGSDGNLTSLFTATLDGLGPVGDGAHAVHEHVLVDSMPERSALLALLLALPPLEVC